MQKQTFANGITESLRIYSLFLLLTLQKMLQVAGPSQLKCPNLSPTFWAIRRKAHIILPRPLRTHRHLFSTKFALPADVTTSKRPPKSCATTTAPAAWQAACLPAPENILWRSHYARMGGCSSSPHFGGLLFTLSPSNLASLLYQFPTLLVYCISFQPCNFTYKFPTLQPCLSTLQPCNLAVVISNVATFFFLNFPNPCFEPHIVSSCVALL